MPTTNVWAQSWDDVPELETPEKSLKRPASELAPREDAVDPLLEALASPSLEASVVKCTIRNCGEDDATRGRGVFTTAAVERGHVLCSIPLASVAWTRTGLLEFAAANRQELGLDAFLHAIVRAALPDEEDVEESFREMMGEEKLLFALAVAYFTCAEDVRTAELSTATAKAQLALWRAYVDMLPSRLDTPVFLQVSRPDDGSDAAASSARALLQGTDLAAALPFKIRALDYEFKTFSPVFAEFFGKDRVSFPQFVLWEGIVRSRVLSVADGAAAEGVTLVGGDDQLAMVPLVDCVNHSATVSNSRWALSADGRAVTLVAAAELPEGAEVLISYGDMPNSELLWSHGFAIPDNPHDRAALVNIVVEEPDEQLFGFKRLALLHASVPRRLELLATTGSESAWDLVSPASRALLSTWALSREQVRALGFDLEDVAGLPARVAAELPSDAACLEEFFEQRLSADQAGALREQALVILARKVGEALRILGPCDAATVLGGVSFEEASGDADLLPLLPLLVYRASRRAILLHFAQLLSG